jgi:hypothetical protein
MLKKTLIAVVTLVGLGVVASLVANRYAKN